MMELKVIPCALSVCKVKDYSLTDLDAPYCFTGRTDEELSLVCQTALVPGNTTDRDDGWRAFRIQGTLDFSLVGILAAIAGLLAEARVAIFALSTFNTDYVLVKEEQLGNALEVLRSAGYTVTE